MNKNSMAREMFSRILSVLVVSVLTLESAVQPAQAALSNPVAFAQLIPPSSMGELTASFSKNASANAVPDVVVIEDLHFNYSVQKNIARLLELLAAKKVLGARIAVEGTAGPVDNSLLSEMVSPQQRLELSDFLLRNGQITGTQFYSIMSQQPKLLEGIEDPLYFQANRAIFQKSYDARQQAVRRIHDLTARLSTLTSVYYSKSVRASERLRKDFEAGKLGLEDYWKAISAKAEKVGVPQPAIFSAYTASSAQVRAKLLIQGGLLNAVDAYAEATEIALARGEQEKNLIQVLHELKLAERTLQQHSTLPEVRYIAQHIDQLGAIIRLLLPDQDPTIQADLQDLQDALRASVDFYVAALMRNPKMLENTLKLVPQNRAKGTTTVLVVGGFHGDYMCEELQRRGYSYALYVPHVEQHTAADDALYTQRFLGHEFTAAEAAERLLSNPSAPASAHNFNGAGIIFAIPEWVRSLRDRVVIGGGLASMQVRAWARAVAPRRLAPPEIEPADPYFELASIVAQQMRKAMSSRLFVLAAVGWFLTIPAILSHEIPHIVTAFPQIKNGEVKIDWKELWFGRPLKPAIAGGQLPFFSKGQRWAGIIGNVVVAAVIFSFPVWLPLSAPLHMLAVFVAGGNLLMVLAQALIEGYTQSGEIYTSLLDFDKNYPGLLSVKEGQKQLWSSVDHYLQSKNATRSDYVFLLKLDSSFHAIADQRLGMQLSRQLRQRIYRELTNELRTRYPGTWIAATDSEDTLMVILPERHGGRETLYAGLNLMIRDMGTRWMNTGYSITDAPEWPAIAFQLGKKSPKKLRQIEQTLRNNGIYLSTYAGGMSFVLKPLLTSSEVVTSISKIGPMNINITQERLNQVLAHVNSQLKDLGVEDVLTLDVASGEKKYPTCPITISAAGTSLHKADEVGAWENPVDARELAKHGYHKDTRIPAAQAILDQVAPPLVNKKVNPARRAMILRNVKRVLRGILKEQEGLYRAMMIQRESIGPNVIVVQSSLDTNNREPVDLPTDEDLFRDQTVAKYTDPVAAKQRYIRDLAGLILLDFSTRLNPTVQRMHRDWLQMVAMYQAYKQKTNARIKHVYYSAWKTPQSEWFKMRKQADAWAPNTELDARANPVVSPYKFGSADGNGMALLGVMRQWFREFVVSRNFQPGRTYNLRQELGTEMFATLFGAGQATRNHLSTTGKFSLPTPIPSSQDSSKPTTLERNLAVHAATIETIFPTKTEDEKPVGGFILLYGDSLITLDPDLIRLYFAENPSAAEGFSLFHRKVPFEESVDYGVARILDNGRADAFAEKPGQTILEKAYGKKGKDAIELVRGSIQGKPLAWLDSETRRLGLGNSYGDIKRTLREGLDDLQLLSEGDFVYMNTAVGVMGTGTLIRFLQMSGAEIDNDGNFTVTKSQQAPQRNGDAQGVISGAQVHLVELLENVNDQLPQAIDELCKSISKETADPYGTRKRTLARLKILAQDLKETDDYEGPLKKAIQGLGQEIGLLGGLLRDDILNAKNESNVDNMGDFVRKMAIQANFYDEVFSDPIKKLAGSPEDEKNLKELAAQAEAHMRMLQETKAVDWWANDPISMELEIKMARLRRNLNPNDSATEAYRRDLPIYKAYAKARWHFEMWKILHSPGGQRGSGSVYAPRIEGAWFDTGALQNVRDYYLRITPEGKEISAVFGFQPMLYSAVADQPTHALASRISEFVQRDPGALFIESDITVSRFFSGKDSTARFIADRGSVVRSASLPWPLHLYENTTLVGAVLRASIFDEDATNSKGEESLVAYSLWNKEANPNGNTKYFTGDLLEDTEVEKKDPVTGEVIKDAVTGETVKEIIPAWLPSLNIDSSLVWPIDENGRQTKKVLYEAKLFPGVSLQLLTAAMAEKTGDELRRAAIDDLDWDIFVAMPEIVEWLQHKSQGPPEVWLRAQKARRLFAMASHYAHLNPSGHKNSADDRMDDLSKALDGSTEGSEFRKVSPDWIIGLPSKESLEQADARQHVSVSDSRRFGKLLATGSVVTTILGTAAIMGSLFLHLALPIFIPFVAVGLAMYGLHGARFILDQAQALKNAQSAAENERIEGNSTIDPAVMARFQENLRATYAINGMKMEFVDDGTIYFVRDSNTLFVDPVVAYFLNEDATDKLHSILSVHEPSHQRWGENVALFLQAYHAPLYLAGFVKSPTARPVMWLLAPLLLVLALLDHVVADMLRFFSRHFGTPPPADPVMRATLERQSHQLSDVLKAPLVPQAPAPSGTWLDFWSGVRHLWGHSVTSRSFDEMAARAQLASA